MMFEVIMMMIISFVTGGVLAVLVLAFFAGKQDCFKEERRMYEEWKRERN